MRLPTTREEEEIDGAAKKEIKEAEMPAAGGGIDALCYDALAEILVRLPSESVLRCGAVCKSWRRITTRRPFLEAHAGRSPREMIILTQSWKMSAVPLSPELTVADDGARRRYLCDPSLYDGKGNWTGWGKLLSSLDGLLVLEQRAGLYVVCNPTTRQWTNLPVLAPRPCSAAFPCGFYHHRPSGEYRLLCHGQELGGDYYDYYILSAGSTVPRRLAARAPAIKSGYQHPVAHRAVLHWFSMHPQGTRTGKMLAFRTDSETFRLMSRPPAPAGPLLEIDGALCALGTQQGGTLLNIWVLQDYEAERWALCRRVEMLQPPGGCLLDGSYFLAIGSAISAGGGTILVGGSSALVIRSYDLKRMQAKQMQFHSTPAFLMFRESLVSHSFFKAPRCPELAPLKFPD